MSSLISFEITDTGGDAVNGLTGFSFLNFAFIVDLLGGSKKEDDIHGGSFLSTVDPL